MRERKISEREIRSLLDDDKAESNLNGVGNTIKQRTAGDYLFRIGSHPWRGGKEISSIHRRTYCLRS
ncbi:MAG TPA: hypothetical protein VJ044_16850, partial [Candidatus Hodarchaeales archaeon]|nr:hypothetical protein [Candidatus Hodarchaeales archaeon]